MTAISDTFSENEAHSADAMIRGFGVVSWRMAGRLSWGATERNSVAGGAAEML